jgi:hypothetical protein
MSLTELQINLLDNCLHDYTELWLIIVKVSQGSYPVGLVPEPIFLRTIEVVREMLESGLFVAGNLSLTNNEDEFKPLGFSVEDTISYIKKEWINQGCEAPWVGYICWFQLTQAGLEVAHELGLNSGK